MRVLRGLTAIICVALGLTVGALNHRQVSVDLGAVTVMASTGIVLLASLLLGALLAGLVLALSVIIPMRRQLGRLQASQARTQPDRPS